MFPVGRGGAQIGDHAHVRVHGAHAYEGRVAFGGIVGDGDVILYRGEHRVARNLRKNRGAVEENQQIKQKNRAENVCFKHHGSEIEDDAAPRVYMQGDDSLNKITPDLEYIDGKCVGFDKNGKALLDCAAM